MSLLNSYSIEEAKGDALDESAKGTGYTLWAVIAAVIIVSVAVAVFVIAGEKPPAAAGELVEVWTHPRHVETSGIDANGAPMAKESFDEVLIFAYVKLRNQSKGPLVMEDALTNMKQSDGILSISSGSAGQYDQVFLAYPEIAALHQTSLSPHAVIDAGKSVEGTLFWAVRMSKQEWDARKDLSFTFKFQYQPSLTLTPHSAVTER